MKKILMCSIIALSLSGLFTSSFATKKVAHFISLPFIEGAGIYTSVMALRDGNSVNTKVSGVTSLTLLATQATLGVMMALKVDEKAPKLRSIHRFVAYTVVATGIWLAISASVDSGTKGTAAQYTSYAFPACAVFPILLFSF